MSKKTQTEKKRIAQKKKLKSKYRKSNYEYR